MAERRERSSTGLFIGIIVALALLAIAYLVFSANSSPKKVAALSAPQTVLQEPLVSVG